MITTEELKVKLAEYGTAVKLSLIHISEPTRH